MGIAGCNDIQKLLETLEEMKLGSEPKNKADQNESADYWEKKDEIQKHVESL
jgi:hypothetical protein